MAKFSSNANTSATTKIPPFLVSCGYISCMSFDLVDLTALSIRKRLANAKAKSIADCMQKVWYFTRAKMAKLQQAQVKVANKHRKPSPEYKVGDKVWLSTKNIHTEKPLKKLDHKRIGPYPIKELVSSLYWLELLTLMQIHNVFHPNLFRLAAKNPLLGQINDPPPPVVVNNKSLANPKTGSKLPCGWSSKCLHFQASATHCNLIPRATSVSSLPATDQPI